MEYSSELTPKEWSQKILEETKLAKCPFSGCEEKPEFKNAFGLEVHITRFHAIPKDKRWNRRPNSNPPGPSIRKKEDKVANLPLLHYCPSCGFGDLIEYAAAMSLLKGHKP